MKPEILPSEYIQMPTLTGNLVPVFMSTASHDF